MASKETLGRIRHLGLASQQRRLRHLHSVSGRNIIPKFALSGDTLVDCLLETYFSLHDYEGTCEAIYTSEKITYSLNPTWASFELNTGNDFSKSSSTLFMVRLWGGHGSTFSLIIEWKVDLTMLHYLGDQVRTSNHPPNTLIFGLVDGYYGAPNAMPTGVLEPQLNLSVKVDQDQVIPSYNKASLQRLRSLQLAIRQTQISVHQYQQSIEASLLTTEQSMLQLSKQESVKLRLKVLREELVSKNALIKKEREEEKKMLQTIRKRERNVSKKRKEFEEKTLLLREHKQAYVDKRESLLKLNAQLNMRKRQLTCELTYIYPIIQNGAKDFFICGVRLPNTESEEFFATDDETLSCALGYACHLVYMISKILEVPQRYAMNPMGSRSTIMDYTIEKVTEKDREFPLHTKGKEKIQFYYGIFLLNKNIAQLRQFCNLGTPNLRNTLPNIKDTLETKFQASMESRKTTINEPVPITTFKTPSNNTSQQQETKIDNVVTPSVSPKKPPLMPKPINIQRQTVEEESSKLPNASPSKPPLPPKPHSLRHSSERKETLSDRENELLNVVNYDFATDQEGLQSQSIPVESSSTSTKNNGTVKLESSMKPPPPSTTHKFFDKRLKKSSRSFSSSDFSSHNKESSKRNSTWSRKRRSLNDVRGVPVEVMRERAALSAKHGTSTTIAELEAGSSATENQESTAELESQNAKFLNSSNGIDDHSSQENTTSDLL